MMRQYDFSTGIGRKIAETVKFVLTAILIAVIMVTLTQAKTIAVLIWEYWTKVDLGYMWTANIILAIALTKIMFRKRRGAVVFFIKGAIIFIFAILFDCVLWHGKDIWNIISPQITWNRLMLAGAGILAATIAFILHIKDIDYNGDEDEEIKAEKKKKIKVAEKDYDSAE